MYEFLWNEEAVLCARMMDITTIAQIIFSEMVVQWILTWYTSICTDVGIRRRFNCNNNVVIKNDIYIIRAYNAYM